MLMFLSLFYIIYLL